MAPPNSIMKFELFSILKHLCIRHDSASKVVENFELFYRYILCTDFVQ